MSIEGLSREVERRDETGREKREIPEPYGYNLEQEMSNLRRAVAELTRELQEVHQVLRVVADQLRIATGRTPV